MLKPLSSSESSACCKPAVFTLFFLRALFGAGHIFSAHGKDLVSVSIIGRGQQELSSLTYAPQAVFSIVAVDRRSPFRLLFDQVSVIIIDIIVTS